MMMRRDFLKLGVLPGAAGLVASGNRIEAAGTDLGMLRGEGPPILKSYTAEDHRRRLANILFCRESVLSSMRRHLVTGYLPAHACYNLGEYPSRTRWAPGELDDEELDRLRDHGIQIVQVFDDWNDSLRLFGGHKLSAVNPEGFRAFVDKVHRRGMKILLYVSTGFIQRTDPDFRPEWSRENDFLVLGYWNMARCAPASAGWRAYFFPRVLEVLEDYGADGIYNDCGYLANFHNLKGPATPDEVAAFEETADYDGALTDLLGLLYAEVKRRGGIFKLHVNAAEQPMTRGEKVYDYLWVGEGVDNLDAMREKVKNYPPYVVPCPDMTFTKIGNKDEPYLHSIPYLQFPILHSGRPFTGERAMVPGVQYAGDDFWMRLCRQAWEYHQAHPEGPYPYSAWDSIPPRAESRPTHRAWLERYLPLVEEGTYAWLEVRDSNLFAQSLPRNMAASVFANRNVHLVLANYAQEAVDLAMRDEYVATNAPDIAPKRAWTIGGRALEILRLARTAAGSETA